MEPPESADAANPFSLGTDSADEEGPHEIFVHGLKAKFFLDRRADDLLPARYLQMAEHSQIVRKKPWVFRSGVQYARNANVKKWSKTDIRYRGVFRTLHRVPEFGTGLWEGGTEDFRKELDESNIRAQAQVVYALLNEIGDMMNLKRLTEDSQRVFFLKPRLLIYQLEYWTGYREKHRDAPDTDAIISLEFDPGNNNAIPILPISVTNYEEPLKTALADKFKLILCQLLQHVKPLPVPGDKIPDQEIFLIGQHGSKLHIMRTFFPGHKVSSLWCRRELPYTTSLVPPMPPPSPPTSSPSPPEGTSIHIEHSEVNEASRSRSNSNRFYTAENIERVQQHLEATKLNMLDNELDTRTFRVLCTREYDLWHEDDFTAAVHVLVALHMYLLSGSARCGALQAVFNEPPYPPDDSGCQNFEDESEDEEEDDNFGLDDDTGEAIRDTLLQQLEALQCAVWEQQAAFRQGAEESRREEMNSRRKDYEILRQLELMQELGAGRKKSLKVMRRSWWDFVWEDLEGERLERIEGLEVPNEGEGGTANAR